MAPDQEPREQQYRQWLRQVLHGAEHELHALPGDASFRRYIRVRTAEQHCILMDAPPEREDCRPFLRVSRKLAEAGLNVPQVLAEDAERGFVLLSDLGDSLYLDCLNEKTADRLYADALQAVHKMRRLDADDLPAYDETLLRKEMHLFTDWLLDRHCGLGDAESLRGRLEPVFALLVDNALQQPQAFVHRDYHSRNLMQTPGNNPGILDYQDAVRGPVTYDPVSLLKDCYVRWPRERVREWWDGFLDESPDADSFPREQWHRWFDLMGVQRHVKASGIFARLHQRDGKPEYLRDIPRTLSYIVEMGEEHPQLKELADWSDRALNTF